ncbi:zonular occludens toxin domain-containing protein [uncultured Chitinophaga sp.]|uniref:zonular occludens toxin domain-containing protein n=1 Tax=uncultured Chitinophaga sp. TaxID=339340 RepID=UPI002639D4B8|nr:zonular occludens toxin domain-containing protein [uncultured Chitinophaga sp.]
MSNIYFAERKDLYTTSWLLQRRSALANEESVYKKGEPGFAGDHNLYTLFLPEELLQREICIQISKGEKAMAHLICISGPLGAGKTTGASLFPWLWKNGTEALGGQLKLFANYDLYGAERMDTPQDWFKVAEAHGSICIWDEAHRSFDSRRFSDSQNILATELMTFVRKMASIQVFATPSVNRLDTRIREIIEVLIMVRRTAGGTYFDYYDYQADFGGRFGKYLHSKFLPNYKLKAIHRLNLFDSYSFVSKFPLPKTAPEQEKFMIELEAAHMRGLYRFRKDVTPNDDESSLILSS